MREAAIDYHALDGQPEAVVGMTKALQAAGFEVQVTTTDAQHRTGMIRARAVSPRTDL